jgi:hypothetical protein
MAIGIDVLFGFFVHSTQIYSLERSFSLFSDRKAVLFHLAKFLVEAQTMASYNPTSLTPSLLTKVSVISQESEWSCICVLGISHFPISTIFLFNFWNFSDEATKGAGAVNL